MSLANLAIPLVLAGELLFLRSPSSSPIVQNIRLILHSHPSLRIQHCLSATALVFLLSISAGCFASANRCILLFRSSILSTALHYPSQCLHQQSQMVLLQQLPLSQWTGCLMVSASRAQITPHPNPQMAQLLKQTRPTTTSAALVLPVGH